MSTDALQEAIQKGLNERKDWVVDTAGSEWNQPKAETKKEVTPTPPNEVKAEDKKVEEVKTDKTEVLSNSSQEQPKTEVKPEVKVPTFEELLAERTGGKIKDWKEIEAKLNEPKTEFANEQVQKINDYVKNGGKFDDNWLYFQNTDFNAVDDPEVLLTEAMRLKEPGITDKEIAYRLKNDYKIDEWSEEGEEPNEIEEVMSAKMLREATKARQELNEYKEKTSFKAPAKSEEEVQNESKIKDELQKNWEKEVESTVIDKIPVKIDDKESFDVIVSKEEMDAINSLTKPMGTKDFSSVLIHRFLNEKGQLDMKKLKTYLYKAESYENAVKTAFTQGIAKGASSIASNIKNIKFNQDGSPEMPKSKGMNEQMAEQFQEAVKAGKI